MPRGKARAPAFQPGDTRYSHRTVSESTPAAPQYTNALVREKSPYLLQHAHNPVQWHAWGDEAIALARSAQKPIFLSIGYSTCHWCHVMERETFEDVACANYLNEHFISIKVDREERPDVDKIYMGFVQTTTGSGGWPLNVFLTPDLQPFYGGTYFPPEPKYGRMSFRQLLERIVELWQTRKAELIASAADITERLRATVSFDSNNAFPTGERELHGAGQTYLHEFDSHHGGFGGAPKFPRPSVPLYLLRYAHRFHDADAIKAVLKTCDGMAAGGINDQLGGGFARYSVDEKWLVPHFEKMLYDQAQLVQLYLEAFLVGGVSRHAEVVRQTLAYLSRDMTHTDGGFYSAEDADSEGHEGKFYCWTLAEIRSLLTADEAHAVERFLGVTANGNFVDHSHPQPLAGQNVLSEVGGHPKPEEGAALTSARAQLLAARAHRVRPHRDDKVLASWNGMMLGAVARAHAILGDAVYRQAAERNLSFLQRSLWDVQTRTLSHRWREGEKDGIQLLDGYANLLSGVVDLYEATLTPATLEFAVVLAETMMERFYDPTLGGFWQTVQDTPHLLLRNKEDYDGAEPGGNSVAALALLRLSAICERKDWHLAAERTLRLLAQRLHQTPQAVPHLFLALDWILQEPRRVVIAGDPASPEVAGLVHAAHQVFYPHRVILGTQGPVESFARELRPLNGQAQAYCCTGTACQAPTSDKSVVQAFLRQPAPEHR